MSDSFDQQAAHRPAPSPSGSRQDGHSGGSATSSAQARSAAAPSARRATAQAATAPDGVFGCQAHSCCKTSSRCPSNPTIFDRTLLRARRRRARRSARRRSCSTASPRIWPSGCRRCCGSFDVAVDLGTPTDAVRRALVGRQGRHDDRGRARRARLPAFRASRPTRRRCRSRDGSLDLVVSALSLQFVNDLPGTLVQIRRALKPDGLLLAALIGGDTLSELREAFAAAESEIEGGVSPRVAPFADLRELGALLQRAGFALPVVDTDRLTVRYDSVFDADARAAPHGRDQRACASAAARRSGVRPCIGWRRSMRERFADAGRPPARDLRDRLAVGLGAAREPAEAAQAGLGGAAACRCARRKGNIGGRKAGGDLRR